MFNKELKQNFWLVYEGFANNPYGEFFIAGNKSLQKVYCFIFNKELTKYVFQYTQFSVLFFVRKPHSGLCCEELEEAIVQPQGWESKLPCSYSTILTIGRYLNVIRECG